MRDKNTVWKNEWPIAYLSKQISFRLFSGWTGTGEAVTSLLRGVCQQLLHGASHSANAKGVRAQGQHQPCVLSLWVRQTWVILPGSLRWFFSYQVPPLQSLKAAGLPTESRRRRQYPASPSKKTWFQFLSFTHLENLDQVSVPGKEEMWPSVVLYASSGSSEYGIYCQDHAVLVRWQIRVTAACRTACGLEMSLCLWRNELQGATWGLRTPGALEETTETAGRWTNQNVCFLQKKCGNIYVMIIAERKELNEWNCLIITCQKKEKNGGEDEDRDLNFRFSPANSIYTD